MSTVRNRLELVARRVVRLEDLIVKYPEQPKLKKERAAMMWAFSELVELLQIDDPEMQAKARRFDAERLAEE